MSNELSFAVGNQLPVEVQGEISQRIDEIINAHKDNRQELNRLTFESVAALTTADEATAELNNKGFFKRIIGEFTGSNQKTQNLINEQRSIVQYAAKQSLKALVEQNMLSFDLIEAVKTKLNTLTLKVDNEIENIYKGLKEYLNYNQSQIVQLEQRLNRIERRTDILSWKASIGYLQLGTKKYNELDEISKLVCIVRDFYDITKGDWKSPELLILMSTMETLGINPNAPINYSKVIEAVSYDPLLQQKLFDNKSLNMIEVPDYLSAFTLLQKTVALQEDESDVVDTITDMIEENNLSVDRKAIINKMAKNYLAKVAMADLNVELPSFKILVDLLFNLHNIHDASNNNRVEVIEKANYNEPMMSPKKFDFKNMESKKIKSFKLNTDGTQNLIQKKRCLPGILPNVHIATLGAVDHGKSTLAAAITAILSRDGKCKYYSVEEINDTTIYKSDIGRIKYSQIVYETDDNRYTHFDFPTHYDYLKCLISSQFKLDGAILVVSTGDGPMRQTKEQISFAQKLGIPILAVFLSKTELTDVEELKELVEMEIRDLLNDYGFLGDEIPIISGSALMALEGDDESEEVIRYLLECVDYAISQKPVENESFYMEIENVSIEDEQLVLGGEVIRGEIYEGDTIEVVGEEPFSKEVDIIGMRSLKKLGNEALEEINGADLTSSKLYKYQAGEFYKYEDCNYASVGSYINILIDKESMPELYYGQVLVEPQSITSTVSFGAEVYVLSVEDGGSTTALFNNSRPNFLFHGVEVNGVVTLQDNEELCLSGDFVTLHVELSYPVALETGMVFSIIENGKKVGIGTVTEVCE
ncbi:GTP-binding protein [uncultured Veillonella sp.]|uniref:GTP-binding protein n=1 Tax=uncultured Veillonella sp. TaxID=159268 RepID=UPI0025CCCC77|nr:GTP-binding protein [uncultured Veillonella sp.]